MFKVNSEIILASSSPRRQQMLRELQIPHKIVVPDCDETPLENETPEAMVARLALLKAETAAVNFQKAWVIGADVTVTIDGEILGKPESVDDAERMIARIQGRQHQVWGAFAIVNLESGRKIVKAFCSEVKIRDMTSALIKSYVASGEPMDKAGSYGIQGIGAAFVSSVSGSYTNVVGLNIEGLMRELEGLGVVEVA